MSNDVIERLREGAHEVPRVRFDTPAIVNAARHALHRRRAWQAVAGVIAAGLAALMLIGPIHVSGVGTVSMPGSYQVRSGLGLQEPDTPEWPIVDLDELISQFVTKQPSDQTMAREVASLRKYVLPVLQQLRPTWYEDEVCQILEYPRGTFSSDGRCGGRPGEQRFDDRARTDLDRILDAVERTGIPMNELMNATYASDGSVETASFLRFGGGIEWNFAYIYSPSGKPNEWESPLGPVNVTPIGDTGWWFEKAPND